MVHVAGTHKSAQFHGGVVFHRGVRAEGSGLRFGFGKQAFYVHAHNGRGYNAEHRQGGKSAADVGRVQKVFAEVVLFSQGFQTGAGVRDGGKVLAGFFYAGFFHFVPEIRKLRRRFHRAARFAGKNEQRFGRVNAGAGRADPVRVGGVQYDELRPAFLLAEDGAEHFRRQRRAAHPHNYTMLEILFYVISKLQHIVNPFQRPVVHFLPAQEFNDKFHMLFVVFPKSGVLGPEFGVEIKPFQFDFAFSDNTVGHRVCMCLHHKFHHPQSILRPQGLI